MNATEPVKPKSVPCREPGCTHKPFKGKWASVAESTHYHRVHSGRIVVPHEGYKLRSKRRAAKARKARHIESRFSLQNGRSKLEGVRFVNKDGKIDGRTREARQQKEKRGLFEQAVHFCPNCLTNLLAAASGLVKAGQTHMKINGCPKCGCNIKAVAEEIVAAKI